MALPSFDTFVLRAKKHGTFRPALHAALVAKWGKDGPWEMLVSAALKASGYVWKTGEDSRAFVGNLKNNGGTYGLALAVHFLLHRDYPDVAEIVDRQVYKRFPFYDGDEGVFFEEIPKDDAAEVAKRYLELMTESPPVATEVGPVIFWSTASLFLVLIGFLAAAYLLAPAVLPDSKIRFDSDSLVDVLGRDVREHTFGSSVKFVLPYSEKSACSEPLLADAGSLKRIVDEFVATPSNVVLFDFTDPSRIRSDHLTKLAFDLGKGFFVLSRADNDQAVFDRARHSIGVWGYDQYDKERKEFETDMTPSIIALNKYDDFVAVFRPKEPDFDVKNAAARLLYLGFSTHQLDPAERYHDKFALIRDEKEILGETEAIEMIADVIAASASPSVLLALKEAENGARCT